MRFRALAAALPGPLEEPRLGLEDPPTYPESTSFAIHRIGGWEHLQEPPMFHGKKPWAFCEFSYKTNPLSDGI